MIYPYIKDGSITHNKALNMAWLIQERQQLWKWGGLGKLQLTVPLISCLFRVCLFEVIINCEMILKNVILH